MTVEVLYSQYLHCTLLWPAFNRHARVLEEKEHDSLP